FNMNHPIQHYQILSRHDTISQNQDADMENDISNTNTNLFNSYTYRNKINQDLTNIRSDFQSNHVVIRPQIFPPWRPSPKLIQLLNRFQNEILHDYPHVP